MKTLSTIYSILVLATSVGLAQEIHPVWVQHHSGLLNVDPSNKLPILVKAGATGDEAYAAASHGKIEGFVNFLRYDDDHFLLGIAENGVDEATETDPARLDAATKCPDRSLVWIDARTGKWLGVAIQVAIDEAPLATQSANPFWWKIAVDEGAYGQKAVYSGFKYKILRYAPTATVPDANFPAGRPTWAPNATEAWVEPVPEEPNPSRPPLDKFVPAIHYNFIDAGVDPARLPGLPAPVSADDPVWSSYLNSSSGDGSVSFRVKALRVFGSGINTIIFTGGATWRASTHEQELATDDGVNFYPIARLNDRGDGWGAKGHYALGGQPSSIRTAPDGRKWCIQGHFPGTGWEARPGRYTKDPSAPDDIGRDPNAVPPIDANDAGPNHKSRPHFYDPDNRALGGLPAFTWESAGTGGNCPPIHRVDGVDRYDGNWVMTADTKDGADYIVSYAIPSWNQQFGGVGSDWPNSVDPNSVFKPGWVGIHTLDGKMAPGANSAWKLPAYETDQPIVDPSGNAGTGFDYGYNGDVTVYPDLNAPAGSGKALVLVSFGEYGFGVFAVSNAPARGTIVSPSNVTTQQNHPVVLIGQFTGTGSPLLYRWQKGDGAGNFTDISGANGNLAKFGRNSENVSYTIAVAQTSDSGQYRFIVGNTAGAITSAVATVSVTTDSTPPTVLSVSSLDGSAIDLCFDELLDAGNPNDPVADPGSARNVANYVISGGATAQSATLQPDGRGVRLEGVVGLVTPFTVKVTSVRDATRNNPISAPGQTLSGIIQGFTTVDIGDTTEPGSTFACEPGTFDVLAGGADFWGAADSGHFTYKEQSGDFNVRVQIAVNERPSNRNGIMVRESTDPASPMVHISWNPDARYGSFVRAVAGGNVDWFSPERNWVCDQTEPPNVWLALQRVGDDFTAYRSADGQSWTFAGTTTLPLANPVLLGLASNRGGGTGLGHTKFANYGDLKALSIRAEGAVLVLSWTGGGVLEAAPALAGPWSSNGLSQNNPQNVTPTGAQQFFRLR